MKSKWFRFRDDILAIIEGKLNKNSIIQLQETLQQLEEPQVESGMWPLKPQCAMLHLMLHI